MIDALHCPSEPLISMELAVEGTILFLLQNFTVRQTWMLKHHWTDSRRMRAKRTLAFHGEFWQGFIKLSTSHQATAAAVATVFTFAPIAVLTWALVTHGQHRDPSTCADPPTGQARLQATTGFVGNSDFYGLGIRLGIYLQWLGSLVANAALRNERDRMAGAYLTFSLALAVAVMLLVFQRECTFTAEIIIVLNIFWGGTLLVMVPFVRLLADIETTGLGLALIPLIISMIPVSTWFWLRLALYGETDFVPTPGGTSFFLLTRVTPENLQKASRFMAVLCLILCIIPALSSLCLWLVVFLDWTGRRPVEWIVKEEEKGLKEKIRTRLTRLVRRQPRIEKSKSFDNKW